MFPVLLAFLLSLLPSCSACEYSILDLMKLREENDVSECLDEARFDETWDVTGMWPKDGSWDEDDRRALRDSSACLIDRIGKERYEALLKIAVDNGPVPPRVETKAFLRYMERISRESEASDSADGGLRDGGGATDSVKELDTRF
jgi:hypothetical protein